MNYMPAMKNKVYFPPTDIEPIKIREFNSHIFKTCIDPAVNDETLTSFFPGRIFFGKSLDVTNASEIRQALDVLRRIRNAHGILERRNSSIYKSDELTTVLAKEIIELLNETECINVSIGTGYTDELNPTDTVSQCHCLHCELTLPDNYYQWMSARVDSYIGAGKAFAAENIFYLNMRNRITKEPGKTASNIIIDIYGTQVLHSDWAEWLTGYANEFDSDEPTGLELIAGLFHLADTLATIHLVTAAPIVNHGHYCRPTAGDLLTDFWIMMYDISEGSGYSIGVCEVCHRLYIGSSKTKRGHSACMNKQRVKFAKAKKYLRLIESGLTPKEAGVKASISPKTAEALLGPNPTLKG